MSNQRDNENNMLPQPLPPPPPVTPVVPILFQHHQGHINVAQLYRSTKYVDVHFSFESDDGTVTRVPAHKTLLAVTSDVFESTFYGERKESGDIAISDASVAAFEEFLQFFYLSDIQLTAEHVAGVMYLGYKYNVKKCINACVKFLKDRMTIENVCTALSLAIHHNQKELKESCEKYIQLNTADVFKSAGFLNCSKTALAQILKMNFLTCGEVDVFEACMAWIKPQCNQSVLSKVMVKQYLGDLYYQIRFASMTIEEFCALEAKYSDILHDDFHTIIRLIARAPIDLALFNKLPREIKWNGRAIIKCNRDVLLAKPQRYKLDDKEECVFSSSQPLLLGGFRCNWMSFGQTDHRNLRSKSLVEVEIIEGRTLDDSDGKVCLNMTAALKSAYSTVLFPQPILIRPECFYTVSMKGFPENYFYHSSEQHKSMTLDTGIKIDFHNDKIVDGLTVGLIWMLNFNRI